MKRVALTMLVFGLSLLTQMAQADWSPVKRLTWNPGESCFPAIAVDSSKAIHLVWEDDTPGNVEIFYKKSTDGGTTWSVTKRLTSTPEGSYAPAMAIDSNDAIHVVWGDYTSVMSDIYYTSSADGGANWSPVKILTNTSTWSGTAAIAVLPDDSIHVVWEESLPGNIDIYYLRSTDSGASWSAVRRLTWTSGYSRDPAIGASQAIHVVWTDNTPGNSEVYYKKSTDGGTTWSVIKRLTWTSGDSYAAAIAGDAGDTVHIVWKDQALGNAEVYYKKSTDGGTTWSVIKRLTWTSGDSYAPALARDSNDILRLVWHDSTPGNYEIYYKSGPEGGTAWSASQRVTWTLGESAWPAMAIDSDNNIHIVWQDDTSGNKEIYYRKGN